MTFSAPPSEAVRDQLESVTNLARVRDNLAIRGNGKFVSPDMDA